MFIYNTLTEKKEEIKKPANGSLRLYVCGLTVYDRAHIGHARTYIFFDQLVKYLRRYKKIPVVYLQNITDIDDKIIKRAAEANQSPFEVAKKFEVEYLEDMKTLGVDSVNHYPHSSEHIKEVQKQIAEMFNKGLVYQTKNGVYFEVKKFPDYGKLSHQNL